jgi:uncharacterized alkaline shock family protein YloU
MADQKGYIRNSDDKGSVNISEDVVAFIAANAAREIEGVDSFYYSQGKDITSRIGKRNYPRGVKLTIDEDSISFDIYIVVDIGYSISEVGGKIQSAVISAVEGAVGVRVAAVNVHVCGKKKKKRVSK